MRTGPTKKKDLPRAGDRVMPVFPGAVKEGLVLRVVKTAPIPYAVVEWEGGSVGRHTITTLRKVGASS